jgi:hypothetical protein
MLEPEVAKAIRDKFRRRPTADDSPAESARRPSPSSRRTDWAAAVPHQTHPNRAPRMVAIKDLAALERVIARSRDEPPRIPELRVELIRSIAHGWAAQWFTDKTAAPWLTLHVLPADARQFCQLGITPEMLKLPCRMPGRALCGGTLTYLTAFLRRDITIMDIRDELVRTGHPLQT